MQTFLPYPSFHESASVLDSTRLWKQLLEARQIFTSLSDPTYGWQHHSAVRMWRGYRGALYRYATQIYFECIKREIDAGIEFGKFVALVVDFGIIKHADYNDQPFWLGRPEFHLSHQSNLIRKDLCFYRPLFPGVPNDLPYVWPHPLTKPDGTYKLKIRLFK